MNERTCLYGGCSQAARARGYCGNHYARVKRTVGFAPKTLIQRFEEKIRLGEDDCWQWMGSTTSAGYGMKWDGERVIPAHRWSYEYHRAPIPPGLVLDHLCRNTSCVNPWHLEPVTNRVNTQRGRAAEVNGARLRDRTHCPYGHEFTPDNTYKHARGDRQCRTCRRTRDRVARMLAAS
jgi:hypothetical protein